MIENALREIVKLTSLIEPSDDNYFSSLRTIKEIVDKVDLNNEGLKDLFISKIDEDTAQKINNLCARH